jgi:hypothetical protein
MDKYSFTPAELHGEGMVLSYQAYSNLQSQNTSRLTKYYSRKRKTDGRQAYGTGERQTGFWWGNRKEREYFEDRAVDGRILTL